MPNPPMVKCQGCHKKMVTFQSFAYRCKECAEKHIEQLVQQLENKYKEE